MFMWCLSRWILIFQLFLLHVISFSDESKKRSSEINLTLPEKEHIEFVDNYAAIDSIYDFPNPDQEEGDDASIYEADSKLTEYRENVDWNPQIESMDPNDYNDFNDSNDSIDSIYDFPTSVYGEEENISLYDDDDVELIDVNRNFVISGDSKLSLECLRDKAYNLYSQTEKFYIHALLESFFEPIHLWEETRIRNFLELNIPKNYPVQIWDKELKILVLKKIILRLLNRCKCHFHFKHLCVVDITINKKIHNLLSRIISELGSKWEDVRLEKFLLDEDLEECLLSLFPYFNDIYLWGEIYGNRPLFIIQQALEEIDREDEYEKEFITQSYTRLIKEHSVLPINIDNYIEFKELSIMSKSKMKNFVKTIQLIHEIYSDYGHGIEFSDEMKYFVQYFSEKYKIYSGKLIPQDIKSSFIDRNELDLFMKNMYKNILTCSMVKYLKRINLWDVKEKKSIILAILNHISRRKDAFISNDCMDIMEPFLNFVYAVDRQRYDNLVYLFSGKRYAIPCCCL